MTFTARGRLNGDDVALTWTDGSITGSPGAASLVRHLIEQGERLSMTPTGPEVIAALRPSWVALRTITEALDEVYGIDGDVTDPPYFGRDYPAGAVFSA